MKRREFFRYAAATTAVPGLAALSAPASAQTWITSALDRTRLPANIPPAAPALDAAFRDLLARMDRLGWSPFLLSVAGFDLGKALSSEGELFRELPVPTDPALSEFAGRRAIQPGDPAMSLLYHVLAASEVLPASVAPEGYATLDMLDALENYIFDRFDPPHAEDLVPAVFAYEYRQAFKTPHRMHADMAYARTGVSRTGTLASEFDPRRREYSPAAVGEEVLNPCPVVPARFGLFLARPLAHGEANRIGINSIDDRYEFLVPVCKLASGGRHLSGRTIRFTQSHRDEKLARLMHMLGQDQGFDLNAPPFLRVSMSAAQASGERVLAPSNSALVSLKALRGSGVLSPTPAAIVSRASQEDRRARFKVPAKKDSTLNSNRRYTTMKLLDFPEREGIDFILSDFIFGGGRYTTGFRSPRNGPVFVNIREEIRLDDEGKEQAVPLWGDPAHFDRIEQGDYLAGLFLDGLCDGCVSAELVDDPIQTGNAERSWLSKDILPAISIVAAPDFFPRFDPIDLKDYDHFFLEGGTETASGLRLPGNPRVPLPGKPDRSAFPIEQRPKSAETVTATVSAAPCAGRTRKAEGYARHGTFNTLTDTISNVFAPGWDITYSNTPPGADTGNRREDRYIATFGLGSPFPEDMKLCAAANGMWAGSSPDASRTYYPGIEPIKLLGRPPTAVPLLDEELGLHPDSPAVKEHGRDFCFGWDGEQGPFLRLRQEESGESSIEVDYADIMTADYVQNALEGRLDLARLRDLSHHEAIARMQMLGNSIRALPRGGRVRFTDMWLVSAEKVEDWSHGAAAYGVPAALGGRSADGRFSAAPGMFGEGWLFVFAHCPDPGPRRRSSDGRLRQPVQRLYACQGDGRAVRQTRLRPTATPAIQLDWGRPVSV